MWNVGSVCILWILTFGLWRIFLGMCMRGNGCGWETKHGDTLTGWDMLPACSAGHGIFWFAEDAWLKGYSHASTCTHTFTHSHCTFFLVSWLNAYIIQIPMVSHVGHIPCLVSFSQEGSGCVGSHISSSYSFNSIPAPLQPHGWQVLMMRS